MRGRTGRAGRWGVFALLLLLLLAGCQVAGQPVADPGGAALLSPPTSSTLPTTTLPTTATTTTASGTTASSTSPAPEISSTGPPTGSSGSPSGTDAGGDTSVPEAPTDTTPSTATVGPTGSTGPPEPTRPSTSGPSTSGPAGRTVTLGTDDYSFGSVITELWTQALTRKGFTVRGHVYDTNDERLGGIKKGDVDAVLAFNGPMLYSLETDSVFTNRTLIDKQLQAILPAGLTMTPSAPADNREHVTTTAATAAKYKLKEIGDLSRVSGPVTLAVTDDPEDASVLPRVLKKYYDVTVAKTVPADLGGRRALAALTSGTATAALFDNAQYQVSTEKLVLLDDPEVLFVPQNPVAIYREGKLPPAATATLTAVNTALTTDDVRDMQKQRFLDGVPLRTVAAAWLKSKGLG